MALSHGEQSAKELQGVRDEIRKLRDLVEAAQDQPAADPAVKVSLLASLHGQLHVLLSKEERLDIAREAAAAALAEDTLHTDFFQALCAAEEESIDEGAEAGPALLKLTADVIFPELRSPSNRGHGVFPKVLVRKCWKDFRDLVQNQGSSLVIGTPGIGKSVFAWWFIRCLAAQGFTVTYRKEKADRSLLCKAGSVLAGKHGAFDHLRGDPNIWWVYDGMEPDPLVVSSTKNILVVSSPNRDRYKMFLKSPGVVKMVMPRWSLEELLLGLQHIYTASQYPGMTEARVVNLFSYYNGVPRCVLGKPSETSGPDIDKLDLIDFHEAVTTCDAVKVLKGAVQYESVSENYHRLLHLEPTSANYRQYKTEYSSEQAFLQVWQRAGDQGAAALQAFWQAGANDSTQAAMRGQILEIFTKMDLASRSTVYDERRLLRWFGPESKTFTPQKRKETEEPPSRSITIESGRKVAFTFDNTKYAQQLQASWAHPGAWYGRTLLTPVGPTYPEVDCIMLPPPGAGGTVETVEEVELYQITASGEKSINRATLANILDALPDAKKYNLYFVVPKEQFWAFTVSNISRGPVDGQARLDRVQAHVIANVEGEQVLHSYKLVSAAAPAPRRQGCQQRVQQQ